MKVFGPPDAEVLVFTFKEGLLSAVAHDLQLRAEAFTIHVDEAAPAVEARIDPRSLRVVCAMRRGVAAPGVLGRNDCAEIERSLREQVLEAARFPELRFASTAVTGGAVVGRLTLHGRTREIRCAYRAEVGARLVEVRLDQRDFGITPYRAMMGTLKVQAEVLVRVRLPGGPETPAAS